MTVPRPAKHPICLVLWEWSANAVTSVSAANTINRYTCVRYDVVSQRVAHIQHRVELADVSGAEAIAGAQIDARRFKRGCVEI